MHKGRPSGQFFVIVRGDRDRQEWLERAGELWTREVTEAGCFTWAEARAILQAGADGRYLAKARTPRERWPGA